MVEALINVDTLNDFGHPGGALFVDGSDGIISTINRLKHEMSSNGWFIVDVADFHKEGDISLAHSYIGRSDYSIITYDDVKDWTEDNHGLSSLAAFSVTDIQTYLKENGTMTLWPVHCIQDTPGVGLMKGVNPWHDNKVYKWHEGNRVAYSAFEGTEWIGEKPGRTLAEILREKNVEIVHIVGLATDFCVRATVLSALQEWFKVKFHRQGAASVFPENEEAVIAEMKAAGAVIIE